MLGRVVLTRATRRNIPENTILRSHRRENLKSYTTKQQTNSVALSLRAIYTDWRPPLVVEI
jgi:hypothetical protein